MATDALDVVHVTVMPDKRFPLASFRIALTYNVSPTCTVADAGVRVTDATGGELGPAGGPEHATTISTLGVTCSQRCIRVIPFSSE